MPSPALFSGPPFPPFWPPSIEDPLFFPVEVGEPLALRIEGAPILSGLKSVTFTSSISLNGAFCALYSGSSAVTLTDAGGHVPGGRMVLLFPSGGATSITHPFFNAGGDTFTTSQPFALFLSYSDRVVASGKRVVFV